jgi:hypothetical protein
LFGVFQVIRCFQIQLQPLLPPVKNSIERQRGLLLARSVDFHDFGTLVGQQHACQRPRKVMPEVDDPASFKWCRV